MRRYVLLLVCLAAAPPLLAQVVDSTVCDILSNSQGFDGKLVRVKGTVIAGFDEFAIKDASCKQGVNAVWLAYPVGTKAKAGPVAFLQLQLAKNSTGTATAPIRPAVKLDKNKDFKQFDSLLSAAYKSGGMCLGCGKYTVTATLIGRIDGTSAVGVRRDASGKFTSVEGFGNMNRYAARLVLQSVSDVTSQETDYSKAAVVAKGDAVRDSSGDPVAAAHQAARAFPAGSPAADEVEHAAAAFGKPGEDNGVMVGFGVPNEVPRGDGEKGESSSPDGLLFNCTFDMDRLKGDALSKAIVHVGTHIADLRGPQQSANPFQAEYRAWQNTILSAVATQQKTLILPGGYVAWNAAWAPTDRDKMVDQGISSFLTSWVALRN